MNLSDITPVLLTFNEAPNLKRTLSALDEFSDIVIVDSGSTDQTRDIAEALSTVRVIERPFDSHAKQWNFGLDQAKTTWVMSLDADYRVSPELLEEIKVLANSHEDHDAYFAPFRYWVLGAPLRRSILPPRAVLFRRDRCRYVDDGHTQLLTIDGRAGQLTNPVDHDDRKPLSRWLWAQDRYARLEAAKLAEAEDLSSIDRIRRWKWLAPLAVFFHVLILSGAIRDGRRGLYYALQRMIAEAVLSVALLEEELDETG